MTKNEIIEKLRGMAKFPNVTLSRDSEALRKAADLLENLNKKIPENCGTGHCSCIECLKEKS